VLGGILTGGGLLFVLLEKAVSFGSWYDVITGILLMVTVITNPEGLARGIHAIGSRWRVRGRGRELPAAPAVPHRPAGAVPHRQAGAVPHRQETSAEPLLSVRSASVRFGGVTAVGDVSLDVPAGAIVGLIGPNGAGKTSLMDAITGFAPMRGEIVFAGRPIAGLKPHQRVRQGLGRTFQGIELYNDLSVAENVAVGDHSRGGGRDLDGLFALLGLDEVRERPVAELSQGRRQLVSIARSLAGAPDLVLLDEPAAGLDSLESAWLAERLQDVRASGVSILLVDHDMNLMLSSCDFLYVLDFGSVIASGTPAEVRADDKVISAYLGAAHQAEPKPATEAS
jgi:ABC-type branched-subunit amino acid transport system ATPase component